MQAPALKTNEILDSLGALPQGSQAGDFLVRKVQAEIDKLRKVNAADGYMLEGILCAFLRDFDGCREAHNKSMRLEPAQDSILWNYLASLASFAKYSEACYIASMLLSKGYSESRHVKSALWLSLVTLDLDAFNQWCRDFSHKLDDPLLQEVLDEMKSTADAVTKYTDAFPSVINDLDRLYGYVESILDQRGDLLVGVKAKESNFYGQRVLHIDYMIDAESKTIIDMNSSLLERASVDDDFDNWDSLIASFVQVVPGSTGQGKVEYAGNT